MFFRILLFAILLWYGIKYLAKFLFPSSRSGYSKQNHKREGEVTIRHDDKYREQIKRKKKEGEYIDYEDVK